MFAGKKISRAILKFFNIVFIFCFPHLSSASLLLLQTRIRARYFIYRCLYYDLTTLAMFYLTFIRSILFIFTISFFFFNPVIAS